MKQANQRDGVGFWRLWGNQKKMTAPAPRLGRKASARFERSLGLGRSVLSVVLLLIFLASAAWPQQTSTDLTEMSLEKLMDIEVTSVSRKEQKLSKVAAAVYVITQEEIRRSGATNIPDLLRMVPGLQVAQIDANAWAISARGFNGQDANKLLVLIDGRTVYNPLFSGVYWDQQDVPLEDVERIEVIRGPGGTVWGANAVNGVINIITKSAKATQGGLLQAGGGSQTKATGLLRYGGKVSRKGYYRVFTKYFDYGHQVDSSGRPAADGWHMLHGGFRSDWTLSAKDSLSVEGDIYDTHEGQTVTNPFSPTSPSASPSVDRIDADGRSLLGRWNHAFSGRSETTLHIYFDQTGRHQSGFSETVKTVDLDFQHHLALGTRHDLVWGLGYRHVTDRFQSTAGTFANPPPGRDNLFSAFAQDEIRLAHPVWLTLGTKFEHNSFTGFELQPNARLLWAPHAGHALWVAASRAIRQPARIDERTLIETAGPPGQDGSSNVLTQTATPDPTTEELRAYELGYRLEPSHRLSLDLATFYNIYHHLRPSEPGPSGVNDKMRGESYGTEISANWSVFNRWRLSPGYSWLKLNLHRAPSSSDTNVEAAEGDNPRHQFQLRSFLNLPHNFEFDTGLYYVDHLPNQRVPSYTRVDARLGWRLAESIEFSVLGQNLLDDRHFEFLQGRQLVPTQAQRCVYGEVTWRF